MSERPRPRTFRYHQGDGAEDLDRLNALAFPDRNVLVVHLPPGKITSTWTETSVLQTLGQTRTRILEMRDLPETHWTHWLPILGIERVVFFPAENLKDDVLRALDRMDGPVEFWLAARTHEGVRELEDKTDSRARSFEELAAASSGQSTERKWTVDEANYDVGRWPTDPLKARFESLGFPVLEAGTFSHRFTSSFWLASRISGLKELPSGAVARLLRICASNSAGKITPGGYCGAWTSLFRSGQFLEDPEVSDTVRRADDVPLPAFHELNTVDQPLVYGLIKIGFSIPEISGLRFDQVRLERGGRVSIIGIAITGDLAQVLRGALIRWLLQNSTGRCVWKTLVETKESKFHKRSSRENQLRKYYRSAAQHFRQRGVEDQVATGRIVIDTRQTLSDLVEDLPKAFTRSSLDRRQAELLRLAMFEAQPPRRVVQNLVKAGDDVTALIEGWFLERAEQTGVIVNDSTLMSQGFAMTDEIGMLLERTRYEAVRANNSDYRHQDRSREKDLRLIGAKLSRSVHPNWPVGSSHG